MKIYPFNYSLEPQRKRIKKYHVKRNADAEEITATILTKHATWIMKIKLCNQTLYYKTRVFVIEGINVFVRNSDCSFSGSYGAMHLQKIKLPISLSLICA